MELGLIAIFVLGYAAIVFEHPLRINKTAPALMTGVLIWTLYVLFAPDKAKVTDALSHHFAGISEILFFLLGAMTIVELVDAHQGFKVITNRIRTKDSRSLLWVMSVITFFMSSLLDNLTTAIVMVSLLRKLVQDPYERKIFAGMIIIAANAGGAWSPIGDVTTTMLWIGGQISTAGIMKQVFLPSIACLLAPLFFASRSLSGMVDRSSYDYAAAEAAEKIKGSRRMLAVGVGALIFVPIFKIVTHLSPFMGMLFGLSIVWMTSELIHIDKDEEEKKPYSAVHALTRVDAPSVLFFLGILLAISGLEASGLLHRAAVAMNEAIGSIEVITLAIGLLSAIIDNVPLVAASMGMYDLQAFPQDHNLWKFMAYCAGTGGSIVIIGSAAGVAVMGMEKIDFGWYLKRISLLALVGYLAGAGVFLLQESLLQ